MLDETELATVRAAMAVNGCYRIQDVIALTYNTEFYVLVPDVHNAAELGRYYLNDSGMVQMPEKWKAGIDPARFGAHIKEQEQGHFTQQGYLVKSGDKWNEVDRAHIPEEFRAEFGKPGKSKEKQPVRDTLKQAGKPDKDAPGKVRHDHPKAHGPEL